MKQDVVLQCILSDRDTEGDYIKMQDIKEVLDDAVEVRILMSAHCVLQSSRSFDVRAYAIA